MAQRGPGTGRALFLGSGEEDALVLDESLPPLMGQHSHVHTDAWAEKIGRAARCEALTG